jgi:hypothetical protein
VTSGAEFFRLREQLVQAIASDMALSGQAVRIGVLIASLISPEHGCAWPSLDWLRDRSSTSIDKKSTIRAIRQLEGRHFRVERCGSPGRSRVNRYFPIWPPRVAAPPPFSNHERVAIRSQKGGHTVTKRVATRPPEKGIRKLYERGTPSRPKSFQDFMTAYPGGANTGSEDDAFSAWSQIVESGVSPIRLIQSAKEYRRKRDADKSPPWSKAAWRFLEQGDWRSHEPDYASILLLYRKYGRWSFEGPELGKSGCLFPTELIPNDDAEAA